MFRVYVYSSLIVCYLLSTFIQHDILPYLVGILANINILMSSFYTIGLYLYSGLIFYMTGVILYFTTENITFLLQFDSMIGILALFIVLPVLNSLIIVGRYDKHLSTLLRYKVNDVGDLFKRSYIISHILGLFLNIATVPILIQSLRSSLSRSEERRV